MARRVDTDCLRNNSGFAHLCQLTSVHALQKKYSAHDKMDKHIAFSQIVR